MLRDAAVAVLLLWFAILLRFEGEAPPTLGRTLSIFGPIALVLLLLLGSAWGAYGSIPQYASLREMLRLGGVVLATTAGLVVATSVDYVFQGSRTLPVSVPLIWAPFVFLAMGLLLIGPRIRAQILAGKRGPDVAPVLIVGAGDAGEHVARDMLRDPESKFLPVGFVDDDAATHGKEIHGLPVFGPVYRLAQAAAFSGAYQVIIAMPSAPSRVVREVLKQVSDAGLKAKILPSLGELMGARATSSDVRDVDISDLIARNKVRIDMQQIARVIDGRAVLITGAAGSIGSELARQALHFKPRKLVVFDNNETDLFALEQRLRAQAVSQGTVLEMVVADVRDPVRVERIFDDHRPDLVFHAAAYKHVSVMELHPAEAVITNVTGTRNIAEAARKFGCERFVLVSTDKAVNPTSVMGASKRLAEMVIAETSASTSGTIFSSVRFGNVLASRGSVVPIFAEQVRNGGPITVTHPDATRYFMTIEEAVSLICQAAAIGTGGQTFVLEMGEPVKILDLAHRMRTLLAEGGGEDIDIVITDLRSGEKIHEDLWNSGEELLPVQDGILESKHPAAASDDTELHRAIRRLEDLAARHADSSQLVAEMFKIAAPAPDPQTPPDAEVEAVNLPVHG